MIKAGSRVRIVDNKAGSAHNIGDIGKVIRIDKTSIGVAFCFIKVRNLVSDRLTWS